MVNNYSNILALLQSKIDESIDGLSDSKIKSPNDYLEVFKSLNNNIN